MAAACIEIEIRRELQAIGRDRNGRRHYRAPMRQNTDHGGSGSPGSPPQIGVPAGLLCAWAIVAVGQIGEQMKRRAVAHAPVRRQQAVVRRMRVAEGRAGEPRDDLAPAYREQLVAPAPAAVCPGRRRARIPIEHGGLKGRPDRADRESRRHISHRPRRYSSAPALAHGFGEVALEIAEERKRRFRAPFLAHEQHRDHRRQQGDRQRGFDRLRLALAFEPVAERAVADLVVVLQEIDEGGRGQSLPLGSPRGRPPRCADASP